jgi:hypothetical protein
MVGSQIANLIPNLSFGHNLCLKCPNGSCKLIFDIFVSRSFQWYKEPFKQMGFDPCDRLLKIWEPIGTPIPKKGVHLGMWGFTASHSFALLGTWDVTPRLPSWLATLQALTLVANPRLGLQQSCLYACKGLCQHVVGCQLCACVVFSKNYVQNFWTQ